MPADVVDEIEELLSGVRRRAVPERELTTVLFTDIVSSTRQAAALGDRSWRALLDRHDDLTAQLVDAFRGRVVKRTGDGVFATFDGPGRAVECGNALCTAMRHIGLAIRAGVHTGEVERRGDDLGGIAVHIGAHIAAAAGPDEVLVSHTVRDLVAGSGITFESKGHHPLKGLAEEWELFTAEVRT